MSNKHVFPGVTLEILSRLRAEDDGSFRLHLDPGRIGGTLTRRSSVGDVVLRFDHDDQRAEMTVTIVKKPMFLPTPLLLAEMNLALRRATGEDL